MTVRRDGDEVAVHAFHHVLSEKLAEERPAIGEVIGILYLGQVDSGERRYHSYRVAVDRPERGVDWGHYAAADAPEPPASDVPADTAGLPGAGHDDIPF